MNTSIIDYTNSSEINESQHESFKYDEKNSSYEFKITDNTIPLYKYCITAIEEENKKKKVNSIELRISIRFSVHFSLFENSINLPYGYKIDRKGDNSALFEIDKDIAELLGIYTIKKLKSIKIYTMAPNRGWLK